MFGGCSDEKPILIPFQFFPSIALYLRVTLDFKPINKSSRNKNINSTWEKKNGSNWKRIHPYSSIKQSWTVKECSILHSSSAWCRITFIYSQTSLLQTFHITRNLYYQSMLTRRRHFSRNSSPNNRISDMRRSTHHKSILDRISIIECSACLP